MKITHASGRYPKLCTLEQWEQMTKSPETRNLIKEYRETGDRTKKAELPAVLYQGYHPNVYADPAHTTRLAKDLLPTGMFLMDYDHLQHDFHTTPQAAYELYLKTLERLGLELEQVCALCHITPSGDGLRIVQLGRPGSSIAKDQQWLAAEMGLKCDRKVKDISRISFIPQAEDILYQNNNLLFNEPFKNIYNDGNKIKYNNGNKEENRSEAHGQRVGARSSESRVCDKEGEQTADKEAHSEEVRIGAAVLEGGLQVQNGENSALCGRNDAGELGTRTVHRDNGNTEVGLGAADLRDEGVDGQALRVEETSGGGFPAEYHGVAYADIVARLIQNMGGEPHEGDRHNMQVDLAKDLRNITNNRVDWLMQLLPDWGQTADEKQRVVEWAVNRQPCRPSDAFERTMKELFPNGVRVAEKSEDEESLNSQLSIFNYQLNNNLPPALPDRLPPLIELLTRNVMPFQRAAVIFQTLPALAIRLNDSRFMAEDGSDFELSLSSVLVGKQSVGKGCVNKPLHYILRDFISTDNVQRDKEHEWQESQQTRKANEKGEKRQLTPIRVIGSDITPATFVFRQYSNEKSGHLRSFTMVDEIEELYKVSMANGKPDIGQMFKKAFDVGILSSERFSQAAANYQAPLRWNTSASTTPDRVLRFFASMLTDGTLSRVDFCQMQAPSERFKFRYGRYDQAYAAELQPYLDRLDSFRCERDDFGDIIPYELPQLLDLEREMNDYIEDYAEMLPDETWRDYAWRTKLNAMKKICVLYAAAGCQWDDRFPDFFRWLFHYAMWAKMDLFYSSAAQAFMKEAKKHSHGQGTVLDLLPEQFNRSQFYEAVRIGGFTSDPCQYLCKLLDRKRVIRLQKDLFAKAA